MSEDVQYLGTLPGRWLMADDVQARLSALEAVAEAAREEVNNTCDANMRKLQHAEAINCQACWHRKTCSALATLDALEGK